jgi:hypothetical protein
MRSLRCSVVLAALLLLPRGSVHAQADPKELARNDGIVVDNDFETGRTFNGYTAYVHPRLEADVATWKKGMKVLDAGAGRAGFFRDLLARTPGTPRMRSVPQLIAVAVKLPDGTRELPKGITYLEGKLGEKGLVLERSIGLGTVDRLVDVWGPSHYAPLDAILFSYGHLLAKGGKAFLHFEWRVRLQDAEGKPLSMLDYLGSVEGLRVVAHDEYLPMWSESHHLRVEIERTDTPLRVPALRMVSMRADTPPFITYTPEAGAVVDLLPEKGVDAPEVGATQESDAKQASVTRGVIGRVLAAIGLGGLLIEDDVHGAHDVPGAHAPARSDGLIERLEGHRSILADRVRGALAVDAEEKR